MTRGQRVAHLLQRLATRLDHQSRIALDFPVSAQSRPRYGWESPPHPALKAHLDEHRNHYEHVVANLAAFLPDVARIPLAATPDDPLHWRNGYCSGLDALAIYGFIRQHRPQTYLEIGSGYSTLFADRARVDGQLAMRLVSIDPQPRTEVRARCDVALRRPLEQVNLAELPVLQAGDIVFVDGSHRVFESSDVVVTFLELLPSLPAGVLFGVDDIFLPFSYPPDWADRFYSEQYLLAAYLLGGSFRLAPLLPNYYLSRFPVASQGSLWQQPPLDQVNPQGTTMWFVTL